jgi:hypothetical protein
VSYDIVGDIHGHYDKLVALLTKLGYREKLGAWRHPDRTAVFVGDFIDRGPGQVDTVELVRRMADAGTALAIMGNHEFNAIAWATPDPEHPGEYLRPHGRESNQHQHEAFLVEVEGKPRHGQIIDWFKTLPLWLDLARIRVVHACWNDKYMDELRPHLGAGATLTDELIVSSNRKGHSAFVAVEALCKGLEVKLPPGITFQDKYGESRDATRVRWWEKQPITFKRAALAPPDVVEQIPDDPMPEDRRMSPYSGPPVFFGHYWLTSRPAPMTPAVACVDYSAGDGGALVAYRWEGEPELREAHFVSA